MRYASEVQRPRGRWKDRGIKAEYYSRRRVQNTQKSKLKLSMVFLVKRSKVGHLIPLDVRCYTLEVDSEFQSEWSFGLSDKQEICE